MQIYEIEIPKCFEIVSEKFEDARGKFVKTLHNDIFVAHGIQNFFLEEYYSKSYHNVLRGLHFQIPPYDHIKMIYCVAGQVMDAIIDLRYGSPTYGEYRTFELSDANAKILVLDKGIAHGFYTLSQEAIVMYKVSSVYAQDYDKGILWNSVGIPWPTDRPLLSERDKSFPTFHDFKSPFSYQKV